MDKEAPACPDQWLAAVFGGEAGALLRAFDWTTTSLGPPETWPQSLKTVIRIMLASRQPIWIGWGRELIFFYNDPYKSIIGGKHPWAFGKPTALVWQEIWDDIGPLLANAMSGTEGTYVEKQLLIMERNGYPEETYYTFSYSPIADDDGALGGIFCANSEDTERVIGERQLTLLRELAARSAEARTWEDAAGRSMEALAADPFDLPFALLYMAEPGSEHVTLAGAAGLKPGHPAAPAAMAPDELAPDGPAPWAYRAALRKHSPHVVAGVSEMLAGAVLEGGWRQKPEHAAILPVTPSSGGRAGVLIVGLNPFRLLDEHYQGFLGLVAGQIGSAIGNAEAYAQERRRAEALAEIDRAKTAFFSNVSHEFRTPLTLMLGPLEDMLARSKGEAWAGDTGLIEIAHRNGIRLLKLVNALLDFSRIEAGRAQIRREPTDLAAFTADLASNFRAAMDRAGIEFAVDCAPMPGPVPIDRDMWEKIVLNLLSNAFKFTFSGRIGVALRPGAEPGFVELAVSDTGTGIAQSDLPHLFERFHRVEGARGRTIEGSGIGLALVKELVKLHGGALGVSSTLGAGSVFTVSVPAPVSASGAVPDAGAPAAAAPQAAASMRAQAYAEEALRWLPDGGGEMPVEAAAVLATDLPRPGQPAGEAKARILIADDNPDLRDYMRRLLEAEGYAVLLAEDGAAALAAARAEPPDLVLSDVMMPRLDGMGLLAALRADAALAEVPVLLLSARAGEEARIEGLASGADDYLTKPFSARELAARVASNLALARIRRQTEERLREEGHTLEALNEVGAAVAAELDLTRAVQVVTDTATKLTGAAFGSFFYNVLNEKGESYLLYTLSGVPREAFARFPMPRNTDIFAPTFAGTHVVRSADITKDPRYARNDPYFGMPEGHLPVCSYLATPVVSRSGEVLGGLFFGHPEAGVFTDRAERIAVGIARHAANAIDNARLYQAAQTEIAERGKAEAALRDLNDTLEQRVRAVIGERDRLWNLSEDLLVVATYDGRFLNVSPSWTRLLGHGRAALLARPYAALIHAEDLPMVQALLADMRESRRPVHFESRIEATDGSRRWIAWALWPDPDGAQFHGVGRDITADKEAAEALQRADETLRQAQKMEAIGKLTGGVAHDFNNLLQVISGNLQLLIKDFAGSEKAEQRLRNALAGVSRGSKLAAQLLAFGRRQPLAPKVVNLGRLVRGLDDMLRRALGDGVEIETVISGGLWNTLVDPSQVENAMLNLAINARDAMGGHGRLTIEAGNASLDDAYALRHADVRPGQYVMLAVTDTGAGMTAEVMEHVFEPFFTTKPEGQGTGLGLSMVYGFVKQSEGHIKIYSEPGHGTTIRLYLPRAREEEDLAAEVEGGPVTGGTETILVVEDDEDVRVTVVEMLADLGYRVLKAKDAQSALAIIESGIPIDLLFTDVVMPGALRSPELARKARERQPRIAVLFTSGYTDNAIVHGGRLDEGIDLLSKPYAREALARKIRHVLHNQPRAAGGGGGGAGAAAAPAPGAAPGVGPGALPGAGPGAGALDILLVEDDALIRLATADMLRDLGHAVREAGDAEAALAALGEMPADLLITDITLPGMSGLALAAEAVRRQPGLRLVFASGQDVVADEPALAGAVPLRKPYGEESLMAAIERAMSA